MIVAGEEGGRVYVQLVLSQFVRSSSTSFEIMSLSLPSHVVILRLSPAALRTIRGIRVCNIPAIGVCGRDHIAAAGRPGAAQACIKNLTAPITDQRRKTRTYFLVYRAVSSSFVYAHAVSVPRSWTRCFHVLSRAVLQLYWYDSTGRRLSPA